RALADEALKAQIEAILRELPESGDRRLEAELRRRGMVVNGKRVRRLLHTFELSLTRKVRKPKPNPLLETVVLAKERANLVAGLLSEREPDAFEVLYTDFTQLVYGGGKVWFLPILDHRTRMVIGYAISFSPDVQTALQAWERAKAFILTQKRERPKATLHHDQGGAFLSHAWVGHLLLEEGQRLSYSLRGPKENSIVESFFSRFKAEHQDLLLEAKSVEALDALLAERIRYYNEHRLHSSLRDKTPQETLKEALSTSEVCIT
ncbi:MAG: DDE-type integrase/transposase/recombinase, partial [Hydrogenibacillus schlegelii]|nr:DDE-type integrase/transposase/recombinase [Hydrogenibacillus schlegelii]